MISAFVRLVQPLFLPLLKLELKPPHLPEGVTLVRHLKPADAWLGLRYAGALVGIVFQLFVVSAVLVGALAAQKPEAIAIAAGVLLVLLFVMAFTLVTTRIDFELRHYLIGDRSLRVSQGAIVRREVTLSYANVQNIEVMQGPLERLFGIKSVTVSTAGGSAVPGQVDAHQVVIAGITDADAVRELILGMVKKHRDAGLGDAQHASGTAEAADAALLAEVRDAAVALRDAARAAVAVRAAP
jgi:membrane protein YdbS with pleckstrin-like domain